MFIIQTRSFRSWGLFRFPVTHAHTHTYIQNRYKMVFCGIFVWCVVGFVQQVYSFRPVVPVYITVTTTYPIPLCLASDQYKAACPLLDCASESGYLYDTMFTKIKVTNYDVVNYNDWANIFIRSFLKTTPSSTVIAIFCNVSNFLQFYELYCEVFWYEQVKFRNISLARLISVFA